MTIHFWPNNHWILLSKNQAPGNLQTTRGAPGNMEQLTRLECNESALALGIQFNLSGLMETEYLRSKAIKWAAQMRSGHL
jgi:hypothetical protein